MNSKSNPYCPACSVRLHCKEARVTGGKIKCSHFDLRSWLDLMYCPCEFPCWRSCSLYRPETPQPRCWISLAPVQARSTAGPWPFPSANVALVSCHDANLYLVRSCGCHDGQCSLMNVSAPPLVVDRWRSTQSHCWLASLRLESKESRDCGWLGRVAGPRPFWRCGLYWGRWFET
jgi:hypothetical protein